MTEPVLPFHVAALYQFARFDDCEAIKAPLARLCGTQGVKGTLLLAPEGINGTIAGSDAAIEEVLAHIRGLPGCAALDVKHSRAASMPFHRMKVRIKREIVTMGEPDLDPTDAGEYVAPEDWNALIDAPDTILIDTRNDYEVAIGSFAGAIDPKTHSFSQFPEWVRAHRHEWEGRRGEKPRIAMFCTGGIRCEKSTALLKAEGLDQVYHLKGGILAYLEQVPAGQSRWQGECFVFDERVSVGHGLELGSYGLCRACRRPVSEADQRSPLFVEGVACPACHAERTDAQRERYAERHRQAELAAARGEAHIGASFVEHEAD
ncbi:oxygen-dependent tRNA uridine(34) hydroxylase TrhO [Sphingomonas psychrotolerans]|uniref:oxygen-dependent tRNA uridine(34) hydroxylase TrhO n=1 Tax=Sphingomonas psychrotolerans TaxID=1327635 RepID=UPI001F330170|nr:rhodanese-related sulfurtransferase [Sphingomonas psychrotolerans]